MKINQTSVTKQLLSSWNVQLETYNILQLDHEIVEAIAKAKQQLPFPKDYQPERIDILFEDRIHLTRLNGRYTQYKNWKGNGHPKFIEFRFDGECALFSVQGDVLVDRVYQMVNRDPDLDEQLRRLQETFSN